MNKNILCFLFSAFFILGCDNGLKGAEKNEAASTNANTNNGHVVSNDSQIIKTPDDIFTLENYPISIGRVEAAVTRLYRGALNRDPDESGLKAYTEHILQNAKNLKGWIDALKSITSSEEFKNEIKSKKSESEILVHFYEGFLGPNRPVDASGKLAYLPMLIEGQYKEVAMALATSKEFFEKLGHFPDLTQARAEEAVTKLYKALLRRDPDEGGLKAHTQAVVNHGFNGYLRVIYTMAESQEFHKEIISKYSNKQILEKLYEELLGPNRPVDEAGEAVYLPQLDEGHYTRVTISIAASDEFFSKLTPTQHHKVKKRKGLVRLQGKSFVDEDGPFYALGATMMWAAWAYKHDRAKLERNLEVLSKNGFHYIRALGVVGRLPWWEGRVIDWRWPDYDQVIAGLTDLVYDKYGMRIEWTLIGDGDQMIPSERDRFRLMDRFLNMSRGREHKIIHFEVANEAWQNGFQPPRGYTQLNALAKYLNDRTNILVATSSASGLEYNGDYCKELDDMNRNGAADLWIMHYDRNVRVADGYWRHVRQPWEHCNKPISNNEPMGPGSSVSQTYDPYHLIAAAIVTYVSNGPAYVYHTEAGVWGGTIKEFSGKGDLYEYPTTDQFQAMLRYLPEDLVTWSRQNTYRNPKHPFVIWADNQRDAIWVEPGAKNGVVRAYAATKDNNFLVIPIGIKEFVKLEAQHNMKFCVIDLVSGDILSRHSMHPGQSFKLAQGPGAYLIKGKFNSNTDGCE